MSEIDRIVECFACGVPEGPTVKIIRFGLRDSRQETTAGGIFLCASCWKATTRIRPRRGRRVQLRRQPKQEAQVAA